MAGDAEPGFRLRAGLPGDLDALYELDTVCFEAPFRFSRGAMRRLTREPGAFTKVIESGLGALAGFLVCQVNEAPGASGSREAYVVTLDVAPAFRRQGIAGRLLEAAEREARRAGTDRITLHVWTENAAAIRFYESCGFQRLQLHADFYAPGIDGFGYSKGLAKIEA